MAGGNRWPDPAAVRKAIAEDRIPPVWLWAGPETFLKDEMLEGLAARVMEESVRSLNVNRFRAGEDGLDQVLHLCRTFPMLSDRRVVFLDSIEALGKADRARLVEHVGQPVPETVLVLSGNRGPGDSFHRTLVASGAAPAVFWAPFEADAVRWVQERFRKRGKRCPREAALDLVRSCTGEGGGQVSLRDLATEVDKVVLNLGERTAVTPKDLAVVARHADEALLYEIVRRVTARDLGGAVDWILGAGSV